ncbi:MAG: hypothetical protein CL959_01690 [Euryarchaeota archaeon]|nr:hypothetical protein [Euryarchaeota archaeon]|tara:strand:- start:918 stop:1175 length:258 start_codon:yes stop_codon:yes gene_type:complete
MTTSSLLHRFSNEVTAPAELLIHLVRNLTIEPGQITAEAIDRSSVFDDDDDLAEFWDMLHFTTKEEIAADVCVALTEIDELLLFL